MEMKIKLLQKSINGLYHFEQLIGKFVRERDRERSFRPCSDGGGCSGLSFTSKKTFCFFLISLHWMSTVDVDRVQATFFITPCLKNHHTWTLVTFLLEPGNVYASFFTLPIIIPEIRLNSQNNFQIRKLKSKKKIVWQVTANSHHQLLKPVQ